MNNSRNRQNEEKIEKPRNIYAFIDSQNLNVTVQNMGWKMDWIKFRSFLRKKYGVNKAFMFIGYVPEYEAMYQQLHEAGYSVVLKPTFDMTRVQPSEGQPIASGQKADEKPKKTQEEERHIKGNIDADLVLWAMKEIDTYAQAVIVSGDGDFYCLVEYLVEQGKLLKLLTPSGHYSRLYNAYESYIDRIDTNRRQLSYKDYRKKKPA